MIDPAAGARSRNAAATREAILLSARKRFAREGYDGASLREISADAGVDAALISRYFGGKDELFNEVLAIACKPNVDVFTGDPATFGERAARILLDDPIDSMKLDMLLIMLRSAGSPKAAEAVSACGRQEFFARFETWLGGPHAATRARLAAAMMMGVSLLRMIDGGRDLKGADADLFRRRLADVLQRCLAPAEAA